MTKNEFPVVDWSYWLAINPDIIGWITVPGTAIDYPVVQAPTEDPTFYLYHDVYKEWNFMGCPYLDAGCINSGYTNSSNAVVFAHNLGYGDDSMFAPFASFGDASFANEHESILIQTPEEKIRLRVFAANCIGGWSTDKRTSFEDNLDFETYRNGLFKNASVKINEPREDSRVMWTFVTCSYNYWDNERTLVFAEKEP